MRLLIIGSLNGQIGAASQIAMARGAKVLHAGDIARALETLRAGRGADLIMIDAGDNIPLLVRSLADERIVIPVVACGVGVSPEVAVRAIKAGAKEYIPLPPDAELIAAVFEAVAEESQSVIYKDAAMAQVIALADQIAPSDASVLITGASGTGKEVLARYIHRKSARAEKPFVSVNCAAIPDNLLESELFGHEKGAFTGAVARRVGKFEEADGGTLLLDEISEMDPRLQAKLLRALQEREIDRVGGTKPVKVDIRVLATSNRDLTTEVSAGRFREDLYFRLNVLNLRLPSLKDRPADIPLLCEHFIRKYAEANGLPPRPLSEAARTLLLSHAWRGNVRELENTMHRAVLLAKGGEIGPEAVMIEGGIKPAGSNTADGANGADAPLVTVGGLVGRTVAEVERDLIIDTLSHCLGNRTHAANILGISIRTLRNKLKQYHADGVAIPRSGEAGPAAA
ncbi:MAG: sigma-54-dependent transcriptional regulator [Alphaproteobacteria bacterium]